MVFAIAGARVLVWGAGEGEGAAGGVIMTVFAVVVVVVIFHGVYMWLVLLYVQRLVVGVMVMKLMVHLYRKGYEELMWERERKVGYGGRERRWHVGFKVRKLRWCE